MDQDQCEAMAREIEQLRCALVSRDIIGQAKGILMERFPDRRRGGLRFVGGALAALEHPRRSHCSKGLEIGQPR
jgi:hypothetical protein